MSFVIEKRLGKIKQVLSKKKIDALLFYYDGESRNITQANLFYFTGIWFLEPAILIISGNNSEKNIDDVLYTSYPIESEVPYNVKRITKAEKLFAKDKEILLGIDQGFGYSSYKKLTKKYKLSGFVDITKDILKMRSIKSKEEIANIKTACKLQREILSDIENKNLFGRSEKQLQSKIDIAILEQGCTNAFETLAAVDKNTSYIHHLPTNSIAKKSILLDFGLNYNHYNSDMTRMFFSSGVDGVAKEAYSALEELQSQMDDFIKPGISFGKITDFAKSFLEEDYKDSNFSNFHLLGHGIGLHVHEAPGYKKEERVEENMVFTIEPGIYVEGKYGVRLEDTVVMRKNRIERL
ncbi:MAG: aminopeptidase P family protein [Candidatus Aenigmarchaeota archaeon]|nr:aminopeptidase P family protein [Candidatus Aenigmarchaeota archaeon]